MTPQDHVVLSRRCAVLAIDSLRRLQHLWSLRRRCVPSAELPKDENGADQGLSSGTLVVEASFELPGPGWSPS